MSEIILISDSDNSQIRLLRSIAGRWSLPCRSVYQDAQQNITLSDSGVNIGGRKIKSPGAAIQFGIRPDYFALPPDARSDMNMSAFRDEQISAEQQLSHIMSMMEILRRQEGFHVVNNPLERFDYFAQTSLLLRLKRGGANVPEILLTNSFDSLRKSELWNSADVFWWSHPFADSPIKIIEKDKCRRLFDSGDSIPIQLMRPVEGRMLRIWLLGGLPLLIARQYPPEYSDEREGLERFEYFAPDDNAREFGTAINNYINGFYEINGILDEDGKLWIVRFDPDPSFMLLGPRGREYLAGGLMQNLARLAGIDINIDTALPDTPEDRETVFLTRMIETLINIEKARGEA